MKKIILLIVFFSAIGMNAQRFDWVATAGYQGVANGYNGAIARDSAGNLYTLDSANATQQCQGMTADPAGGTSIFLYKYLILLGLLVLWEVNIIHYILRMMERLGLLATMLLDNLAMGQIPIGIQLFK